MLTTVPGSELRTLSPVPKPGTTGIYHSLEVVVGRGGDSQDSLSIAFQMKGKQPVSPCSCQGSLRPKLQQRMLQCGSAGAGWVAGRRSQQVCRKLGTTVAPHDSASTKATGEASGMPTGCSSQERKRLRFADVSLEQRVILHNASSVAKLTQSVTSVAI